MKTVDVIILLLYGDDVILRRIFLFLLIVIVITGCVEAVEKGDGYYLKNTTANLLALDRDIITTFSPVLFSSEEQEELNVILGNNDILLIQDRLLRESDLSCYGSGDEDLGSTFAHYQQVVLLDDYFTGFDFVIRQANKVMVAIKPFFID